MTGVLITNDFPPKIGGIQSYLYELWRRMPPEEVTVITTSHPGDSAFDADEAFPIIRGPRVLLPTPQVKKWLLQTLDRLNPEVVVVDPVLPLGMLAPHLRRPYSFVVHGAELNVPSRIPGMRGLAATSMYSAEGVIASGAYAGQVAKRILPDVPVKEIVPGVDTDVFKPASARRRAELRAQFGYGPSEKVVISVSRLVPRKGFDNLIRVLNEFPAIRLVIVGGGRDLWRLEYLAAKRGVADRVDFVSDVSKGKLVEFYQAADIFAMLCRDRWGGAEAEGFGIVFLEAAACGLPVIAGRSGGSPEAVDDGKSGFVIDPHSLVSLRGCLRRLVDSQALRKKMGKCGREWAGRFSYDQLAKELIPFATTAGAFE